MSVRVRIFLAIGFCTSACLIPLLAQIVPLQTYTEEDVRKFVLPGTTREAIIQRFGKPVHIEKNPKFEDGSHPADEILHFELPLHNPPHEERGVFSGFEVWIKDGKAVQWMAGHRDVHLGR